MTTPCLHLPGKGPFPPSTTPGNTCLLWLRAVVQRWERVCLTQRASWKCRRGTPQGEALQPWQVDVWWETSPAPFPSFGTTLRSVFSAGSHTPQQHPAPAAPVITCWAPPSILISLPSSPNFSTPRRCFQGKYLSSLPCLWGDTNTDPTFAQLRTQMQRRSATLTERTELLCPFHARV